MLRKLISYEEYFLNESAEDKVSSELVREIFDTIISDKKQNGEYNLIFDKDLDHPINFEIKVKVKRQEKPELETDSEFKNLPWELHNMADHGFVINANAYIKDEEHEESLIEVVVLIDPTSEPACHKELFYRLHDIISHELHHVTQFDTEEEKQQLRRNPEMRKRREAAEDNYEYFLLDDEIPAMVKGMNRRAVIENRPLDEVFAEYFEPFLKHGFMTEDQYRKVMKTYIEYAIQNKPNARFSEKAKTFLGK